MFNPARPYMLYASFRRHGYIYSWDLRGDVSSPIQRFRRTKTYNGLEDSPARKPAVETNQRLRFDIDIGGNWLAMGDQVWARGGGGKPILLMLFSGWTDLNVRPLQPGW
jgi:telomerase Cajal body protein 1